MRIVIFGNSGAGKSVLARRLAGGQVPVLDLDRLAGEPGPAAVPRDPAAALGDLEAFLDARPEWIIEGCHADLATAALRLNPELLFLDPGTEACLRNGRARPWEAHKYASRAEQDRQLGFLLDWVADYDRRQDGMSRQAHEALFSAYAGPKRRLAGAEQMPPGYPTAGVGPAVVDTERLRLRFLATADAPWFLRLLNEPGWIENIGDRNVRSVAQAEAYLEGGALRSYQVNGHGLNRVELKSTGEPVGICGLIRRDGWADPDLGYALLPEFERRGYATEAGAAVLAQGEADLGVRRCVAFVSRGNEGSIRVLARLGFHAVGTVELAPGDPVELFERNLQAGG